MARNWQDMSKALDQRITKAFTADEWGAGPQNPLWRARTPQQP
jgi:hypothetical protein